MTLSDVMKRHRETTANTLTNIIANDPDTHPELLHTLGQIWGKERADHADDDRTLLQAVANLTPGLLASLQATVHRDGQYAAARCITYLRRAAA